MKTAIPCDCVEKLGKNTIQHGKLNDRVYVMKVDPCDVDRLLDAVDRLTETHKYGKVFAKVPGALGRQFQTRHYIREAAIPAYFSGGDDCLFMSRFLDISRADAPRPPVAEAEAAALAKALPRRLPDGYMLRTCTPEDVDSMAVLYADIFETYPFPIQDPGHIAATMQSNVLYSGIWHGGQLVALSSAECDRTNQAIEMTDFAVAPAARGNGFAAILLAHMETQMREAGYRTAFTIARAVSPGMNITFARMGYTHGGLLVNNTSICGHIESMNVWHKPLSESTAIP